MAFSRVTNCGGYNRFKPEKDAMNLRAPDFPTLFVGRMADMPEFREIEWSDPYPNGIEWDGRKCSCGEMLGPQDRNGLCAVCDDRKMDAEN